MKSSKNTAIVENAKSGLGLRVSPLPGSCAVTPNYDNPFGAFGANPRRTPKGSGPCLNTASFPMERLIAH